MFCGPTQYLVLLNGIKCECFFMIIFVLFRFFSLSLLSFIFSWMFLFRGLKHCKLTVNMAKYQNDGDNNINKRMLTIPTALCGGQSTIPCKEKKRSKSGRERAKITEQQSEEFSLKIATQKDPNSWAECFDQSVFLTRFHFVKHSVIEG